MKLHLSAFFILSTTLFAGNLVVNGDFESGLDSWKKIANKDAEVTWSVDESVFHSGKASLRVANASAKAPNVYGTFSQTISAQPGKTYRLSVWVRGLRASGVRFTMDKKWALRKGPSDGTFDWQEITFAYTAGEGETSLEPRLIVENKTESLWIDDFSVSEEKPPVDSKTFSLAELGASTLLPIPKMENIRIDGDLSDWTEAPTLNLPAKSEQVEVKEWKGNEDLSANVRMAWNESAFYFTARVKDDQHTPLSGEGQYAGDGVQIGFGKGLAYGPEYGFAGENGKPALWCWQKGPTSSGIESIQLAVQRKNGETIYEAAIPWKAIDQSGRPAEIFSVNFLINDNDGKGRRGWLEWMPGIGRSKDPLHFPKVLLVGTGKTRGIFLEGPSDKSFRGDRVTLAVWTYNFTASAEMTRLILPIGEMDLPLPARSLVKNSFSILTDGTGDIKKTATLKSGTTSDEVTTLVQILDYNADSLKTSFENLKPLLADLEKQFEACAAAKIPTDREKVNLSVIRAFIPYGLEDASRARLPRAAYVLADLEKRIADTSASLKALLAKEKTALPVLRYAGGPTVLTNGHFIGDRIDENGKTSRGPIQFLGYGHFGQIRRDIPRLQDYGHNIIQQEIGPRSTVFAPKDSGSFSIDTKALDESIVPLLKNAEAARVSVTLLLSPHYFPKWALEKWPEIANPTSGNFLAVIPDAPEAKAILEAHIRAVVSKVRGLPALHSLTLANEPELIDTRRSPFSQNHWKEWLEKRHGKIETLNKRWGSSYRSFPEVPMQDPNRAEPTPAFYDHSVWNAERFAAWHRWMADVVHKDAPEIPVHVKIMQNIFERADRMGRGVDPEMFCHLSDAAGCDAWLWPNEENWGRDQFAFYDLLRSIKKQPVVNSEDHYIKDRDSIYTPDRAPHVRSALFMGAFHGRETSTAWVWERTFDEKHDFEGSVLHRPDVVAAAGRTSLELGLYADLVAQFNEAPAKVAILYSWPSLVYSPYYATALKTLYDALRQIGQKVDFITERQLRETGTDGTKVIVLPQASHTGEGVLPALAAFVQKGGKIVSAGESVLSRDEWNQPRPEAERKKILDGALAFPFFPNADKLRKDLSLYFVKLGLNEATLIDTANGEGVAGVEYRGLSQNGKRYLVALNFGPTAKKVTIEFTGKKIGAFTDLLTRKEMAFPELNLEPLTPVLLELKNEIFNPR